MTFSNLCELYENACLDYEVSVLTEGADSEEAKTAKAKKTGLARKVFASIGAAFRKLGQMIMRILTFIKRRFVRDKVKLANEIRITPANAYKKILSDIISYSLSIDEKDNMKDTTFLDDEKAEISPLEFTEMDYDSGSVIDKTSYQEVLEKAKRITSKYERLERAATGLTIKHSGEQGETHAMIKTIAYRSILKALSSITTRIDRDMKEIKNNAVPEDVAPVNDKKKKEKVDANNESAMFGGLTRNELRAQLLIEAADLLNEGAASKARKEIIKDIKIQKQEDLYKKFKNAEMDYDEAKKYYSILKKEIVTLRNKLAQIPAETAFEKLNMILGKYVVGTVIGGAIIYAMGFAIGRTNLGHYAGSIIKKIASSTTGSVILALTGIGIAADSALSKIDGEAFNWNKDKTLNKLDKFEKKVDNIMEYYQETHDDEISSKNESIDLFI